MMGTLVSSSTGINPLFLAQSRLRRRRFDDCVSLCSDVLERNALDQQAWFLKVRATTLKNWIDDTELEEEGRLLFTTCHWPPNALSAFAAAICSANPSCTPPCMSSTCALWRQTKLRTSLPPATYLL